MNVDDLPPRPNENELDEGFAGQLGNGFGAMTAAVLLLVLAAFFGLGGIRTIQWIRTLMP